MRIALSIAALAALVASCDDRPRTWQAYVYPDRNDLTQVLEMGSFKTFEQCQQAAINSLRTLGLADAGDYECGYRCGPDERYGGINVCKETRK